MTDVTQRQAMNVVPPRRGSVLVLTLDTTDRPYDISGLAFGKAQDAADADGGLYLTLFAETANCYYYFHSATASDLDETSAVSAGGTAAFADAACAMIMAGTSVDVRIVREVDKFLVVKGSAAGKLRIWASSHPTSL